MVKSIITIVLALVMMFSFAACGNDNNNTGSNEGVTGGGADTKGITDDVKNFDNMMDNNGMNGNEEISESNSDGDIINSTDMGSR